MRKSLRHRVVARRQAKKMQDQKCDGLPPACELENGTAEPVVLPVYRRKNAVFGLVVSGSGGARVLRNRAPKIMAEVKLLF